MNPTIHARVIAHPVLSPGSVSTPLPRLPAPVMTPSEDSLDRSLTQAAAQPSARRDYGPSSSFASALSQPHTVTERMRGPDHASQGAGRWNQRVVQHLRQYAYEYAVVIDKPRRYIRTRIVAFATMTGLGKFVAAYGAFLAAEGFLDGNRGSGAGGCIVSAAGSASFVVGALLFTSTVREIEPTVARALKACSLTGGAVLVGAYTLKGVLASKSGPHSFGLDMTGRALNYVGVAMMQISFPAFCASAQAVYGTIIDDPWMRLATGWFIWNIFGNAAPLIPTATAHTEGAHVGTQFAVAFCSFCSLFGAGLVLSSAFESLGRDMSRATRLADGQAMSGSRRHSSPELLWLHADNSASQPASRPTQGVATLAGKASSMSRKISFARTSD